MLLLWQIFSQVYQSKNFENRSQFGKDMINKQGLGFLEHGVLL